MAPKFLHCVGSCSASGAQDSLRPERSLGCEHSRNPVIAFSMACCISIFTPLHQQPLCSIPIHISISQGFELILLNQLLCCNFTKHICSGLSMITCIMSASNHQILQTRNLLWDKRTNTQIHHSQPLNPKHPEIGIHTRSLRVLTHTNRAAHMPRSCHMPLDMFPNSVVRFSFRTEDLNRFISVHWRFEQAEGVFDGFNHDTPVERMSEEFRVEQWCVVWIRRPECDYSGALRVFENDVGADEGNVGFHGVLVHLEKPRWPM